MKRLAVTMLVLAAMPVILAGALVAYVVFSQDLQPMRWMGEDDATD